MRNLRRLDSWSDFGTLQDRINRMFDDTFRSLSISDSEEMETGNWAPTVDVVENNDNFIVKADIPGVKKDDLKVDVKDGTLTIKGEKKQEEKVEKNNYIRIERSYGNFVRNFSLPGNVDSSKINAKFTDGVLEIKIPKKEEAKPKEIKINVQ